MEASAERDTERLDWLEKNHRARPLPLTGKCRIEVEIKRGTSLRAAIDAAMSADVSASMGESK